ncbi:hypothetical protein [Halococcoides cellulosivorans]|uniref:Uncharacterized protein n=1 Tax=Halococcoides cellulosivorans TaxID=1679096 RepID=A0A2R4X2V2_9EURY|nr:hypothetical protein [Halococcoides cellulosivorans]AWB28120.1 hypothetical protein HARCEL1_10575 [Halococcoides cellulosivorans]
MNEKLWKHVCAQFALLRPMLAVLGALFFLSVIAFLYDAGGSEASMTILLIDFGLLAVATGMTLALYVQCRRFKEKQRDWRF